MSDAIDSGRGVVIGTAGHVDHGKTTLVGALTGIDTDRLPEEKARGISIELGFAWLDLPTGARVAFVDVPGHERFVRQMIAGASGVDAVLLVVAADEGVMPQTREHLAICQILGVDVGAVVLTKVDLVEPEWLALVVDDVRAFVAGTFLAGAPIVAFAAGDAALRADVVACVAALAARVAARAEDERDDRPLVVPYDRVFSAPGFGTIVTGTSMAGRLAVGDEVAVWPDGVAARVRALEVHGARVEAVGPGRRVAVNLPALDAHGRAGVVVHADGPRPTSMIDATFVPVPGLQPIDDGEKGLVHLGTQRVEATLTLLGPATGSQPEGRGAALPAQLRLAQPLVFLPGSPWIFRGFRTWPGRPELGLTLGGGRALAPSPRRRRKTAADAAEVLALAAADPEPGLVAYVAARGEAGADRSPLEVALPWSLRRIRGAVDAATRAGALVSIGPATLVAASALAPLERALVAAVDALHAADPGRVGWPEHELHTRVRPAAPPELIACTIARLIERSLLERVRAAGEADVPGPALVARAGYRPPAAADPEALDRIVATFAAAGLAPPSPKDLVGPDGGPAAPIIDALVKSGRLVRVADLVFARSALADLEARTRAWFASHAWLEAQDLKGLVQGSRKFAIPLGEWLDKARITVRVGDRRRLRG